MQSGAQTVRFALKQWCKQAKWHCVLLLMHIITSHNNTLPTNTGVSICRHFETNMTQTKSLRVWIPDGWVFIVIVLDKVSLFWLINSSNLDFKMCWFWRCWASRWMCLTVCFVALLLLLVVAIMTGWWTALSYQVRASELKFVFGQWLQDECYFQIRLRCVGVLKSSPSRNKREKQERRVHSCTNSRLIQCFWERPDLPRCPVSLLAQAEANKTKEFYAQMTSLPLFPSEMCARTPLNGSFFASLDSFTGAPICMKTGREQGPLPLFSPSPHSFIPKSVTLCALTLCKRAAQHRTLSRLRFGSKCWPDQRNSSSVSWGVCEDKNTLRIILCLSFATKEQGHDSICGTHGPKSPQRWN